MAKLHTMKAYKGSGGKASRINLGYRCEWVISFTPMKETPVPIIKGVVKHMINRLFIFITYRKNFWN